MRPHEGDTSIEQLADGLDGDADVALEGLRQPICGDVGEQLEEPDEIEQDLEGDPKDEELGRVVIVLLQVDDEGAVEQERVVGNQFVVRRADPVRIRMHEVAEPVHPGV